MEWLKLKNSDNTKCWQECRESKLLNTLLVEMNGTATLKTSLAVSLKTKHATTIQPSICVSEQLSQRTGLHMKTCTWIFIAALFILSETGNNQMLKMSFSMWSVRTSLIAQLVKNPPAMRETLVWFLDRENPLAKR